MADLRIRVTAVNQASPALRQVQKEVGGIVSQSSKLVKGNEEVARSFRSLQGELLGAGAVLAGGVLTVKEFYGAAREGASMMRLKESSRNLAKGMGADMDVIVASVRKASNYTVSELGAIESVSKAMMLGLGADTEKYSQLMQIAAFRGRAMGLSTEQAFSDIVRGIGRMSPLILDNLGIVVDGEATMEAYAESVGKVADELTRAEKVSALFARVLDEGNLLMEQSGGFADDALSAYERQEARMQDLVNRGKEWLSVNTDLPQVLYQATFAQGDLNTALEEESRRLLIASSSFEEYSHWLWELSDRTGITIARVRKHALGSNEVTYAYERAIVVQEDYNASLVEGETEMESYKKSLREVKEQIDEISPPDLSPEEIIANIKVVTEAVQESGNTIADFATEWGDKRLVEGGDAWREFFGGIDEVAGTGIVSMHDFKDASEDIFQTWLQSGKTAEDTAKMNEELKKLNAEQVFGVNLDVLGTEDAREAADALAEINGIPRDMIFNVVLNAAGISGDTGGIGAAEMAAGVDLNGNGIIGYARGGSFVVPPGYPGDSYVTTMGLTSGERVTVTPANQGGGGLSRVNFYGSTTFVLPSGRLSKEELLRALL